MKVSSGVKRRCTFGELIECFDNKRIPLSAQERATRKGPYRYYGAQNVVDHIDAYLFDGEYALIAEDGENLRSQKQDVAQIVEGQFWVNNHAHIIQANANADLWYLCALLNQTDISRYISGSAQPKLSQEGMRKIVVEVPDVQEQRRIGLLLRSLDRKIALNRRKIATLEKMAKEIYDYWFVQYDFPDANGRPYKSSGGEMVYSPELKREIPKGWKVGSLADIAQYPQETVRSDNERILTRRDDGSATSALSARGRWLTRRSRRTRRRRGGGTEVHDRRGAFFCLRMYGSREGVSKISIAECAEARFAGRGKQFEKIPFGSGTGNSPSPKEEIVHKDDGCLVQEYGIIVPVSGTCLCMEPDSFGE